MTDVVVIGGGPAGNQAASRAASLGAHVTLVERDVVGGAAHLWDCIPSKAMIATAGALSFSRRMGGLGFSPDGSPSSVDYDALREPDRRRSLPGCKRSVEELLASSGRADRCGARRAFSAPTVAVKGPGRRRGGAER